MILGAGYPKEVQVSVVTFSHLTTATGFSVKKTEKQLQQLKNQSAKCRSGWENPESSAAEENPLKH